MTDGQIVVGIDGSHPAIAALRWAKVEAQRRDHELRVIHAYDVEWPLAEPLHYEHFQGIERGKAQFLVDEAVEQVTAEAPGMSVRGEVVHGRPAPVLIERSCLASLVVVGARGRGGFGGLLAGSVSDQVAEHAHTSVAVVRGRAEAGGGPIVVGVDGSPGSLFAAGVAFEQAARRGRELVAVSVYKAPVPAPRVGAPPLLLDRRQLEEDLTARLLETLGDWREKYPNATLEARVVGGDAAQVLVAASARAQLVVVGARGHGGFERLPLGSVGRQLMHHAECPVLVARPGAAQQAT